MTTPFKYSSLLFLPFALLFNHSSATPPTPKAKRTNTMKTIVIDAGHGGKDPGAPAAPLSESKITLAVALKLGKLIEQNLPDVNVVYTRKTDKFIELYERANIANRNNADLFISIHCNSLPTAKHIRGTEVYVMGLHTADENLEISKKVAERENQTVLMEADYKKHYGGYDPKDPATHILLSMVQNVHLDQSIRIASLISKECKSLGQPVRGVHQAGFVVIRATAMPSILVETGYITNHAENKDLQSHNGQMRLAKAIYKAVKSYKYELEGKKKEDEPTDYSADNLDIADESSNTSTIIEEKNDTAAEAKQTTNRNNKRKLAKEKTQEQETVPRNVEDSTRPAPAPIQTTTIASEAVVFRIQIISNDRALPDGSPIFKGITDAKLEISNGRYRYLIGDYTSLAEANKTRLNLIKKGFKGAFVVKYQNDIRAE